MNKNSGNFQWYPGRVMEQIVDDEYSIKFDDDDTTEAFKYNKGNLMKMNLIWHYTSRKY